MKEDKFDFYSKTNLNSYNLDSSMRYQLSMLDSMDVFTRKHSENVANLTCRICEYLHLPTNFIVYCTICAYLHDIGKLFIPSSVLQSPTKLTDEQYEVMKKHTTLGYNMCMKDLQLRPYAAGALYHHEALDGSGYPQGLSKKDIPIEGQIIRVADIYDALVSKRQYKSHIDISDTLEILINETKPRTDNEMEKKSFALSGLLQEAKCGKTNPKFLKALFNVVIDDIEYEIFCVSEYIEYLQENIARLNLASEYHKKMEYSKKEKDKQFYANGIKMQLQPGESFDNFFGILEEYKEAYTLRSEKIRKLQDEIKKIKKMKKTF